MVVHDTVQRLADVPCPPEATFHRFVREFGAWWPRDYTWSQDELDRIWIEPHAGGRCVERHRNGRETVWGQVLDYHPPDHISFSWLIAPDRTVIADQEQASKVLVQFLADADGTSVELTHVQFSRHGDGWQDYHAAFASPQGWPWLLQRFTEACA